MSSKPEIESQLRAFRVLKGMTQQELGDQVGVTRQTIISIERGNYTPSVALALSLAKVLGATVEQLFQLRAGEQK